MRAFGYRDLKVFFIPFLGAAVSGKSHEATGLQRALVSLAGPVPSLVLAFVLAIGSGFGWSVDLDFVGLMLALNALNLLPFEPLDGGRFLNVVLYHRHPGAESVMRAIGALAIVSAAVAWEDWFLGIFGAFFILGLGHSARIAVAARSLRERLAPADLASPTIPVERYDELARVAYDEVFRSGPAQPKALATTMNGIWEKAGIQSPSPLASFLLLAFYATTIAGLVLVYVTGA